MQVFRYNRIKLLSNNFMMHIKSFIKLATPGTIISKDVFQKFHKFGYTN